jgi:phosphotriesterase-related protein
MIATATGPLDSDELGVVLPHEHVRVRREDVGSQFPHLFDDEHAHRQALSCAARARDLGVRSIFDPTVMGIGRNVRLARRFSEETGLVVVVATGVYTHENLTPYFDSRPVGALMDAFLHEIEHGIQGTDVKPGFLKCASDQLGTTPGVEKVMRATARTHLRTGLPILTHSSASTKGGLVQQDLFEEEGVDLTRVVIGHSGDTTDIGYLKELADRGSFLGLDRYGLDDVLHADQRNDVVVQLCREGYADRLMLSHDCPCTYDRLETDETWGNRQNWNWSFVMESVLPFLRSQGVDDATISLMVEENPRRWILGEGPRGVA